MNDPGSKLLHVHFKEFPLRVLDPTCRVEVVFKDGTAVDFKSEIFHHLLDIVEKLEEIQGLTRLADELIVAMGASNCTHQVFLCFFD